MILSVKVEGFTPRRSNTLRGFATVRDTGAE